ncbi:MAG: hypothetical protein N2258_07460 [Brevinematales bacterium]|nr:hypothetical protein [Brevinematales bacterium]
MKKIVLFIIILLISCKTETTNIKDTQELKITKQIESTNLTKIIANQSSNEEKGLIKIYENNPTVYFILNWTSKSQKSYEVINKNDFDFYKLNGKVIKAKIEVIEERDFSGKLKIISISEIIN